MNLNAERVWADYQALRRQTPLVYNLTNTVVQEFTANALLALGASPLMSEATEEIEELVGHAAALNLNIGTPARPTRLAMLEAARAAAGRGKPFVLDPVAVGATRLRREFAGELITTAVPTVIRGNQAEVAALAGSGWTGRGVDAGGRVPDAIETARMAGARLKTTVIATGETDFVSDGTRLVALRNGHPLLTRVTGTGCVASAFVAAFLAVQPDPVAAGAAAISVLNVAAELAAARSENEGPGSFRVRLLDALDALQERDLAQRLHLQVLDG